MAFCGGEESWPFYTHVCGQRGEGGGGRGRGALKIEELAL